jgi:hypothetical protein
MIDNIMNVVKDQIGDDLMGKFGLDSSQKNEAINITKETITEKISGEAAGGGLSGIMNLFSSNENDSEGNSMLENITRSLSSSFSDKFGIDSDKSDGISSMIMEKVTALFGNKLGSNFDLGDLMRMIGGGKSDGIGGMLGKLGGLFGK